jgi:hypothetical protein
MAPVLKTGIPERVSGVRIPPSPPLLLLSGTCRLVPQDKQGQFGCGDVWTWAGQIDVDSRLIISYVVGTRGPEAAKTFMDDLAKRVANRIQLTSDGYRVYERAVENAFGCEGSNCTTTDVHLLI